MPRGDNLPNVKGGKRKKTNADNFRGGGKAAKTKGSDTTPNKSTMRSVAGLQEHPVELQWTKGRSTRSTSNMYCDISKESDAYIMDMIENVFRDRSHEPNMLCGGYFGMQYACFT